MNEAFKNNIHIETSSAFDINIVKMMANGKINKSTYVICNGFKGTNTLKIFHVNNGHKNTIPIIDNFEELICFRLKLKENLK
jgi:arginine decarboxylase